MGHFCDVFQNKIFVWFGYRITYHKFLINSSNIATNVDSKASRKNIKYPMIIQKEILCDNHVHCILP